MVDDAVVVDVAETVVVVVIDEVGTQYPQSTGQRTRSCALVMLLRHNSNFCSSHKPGSGSPLQIGVVVVVVVSVTEVAVVVVDVVAVAVVVDEVQELHKTGQSIISLSP